MFTLISCGGNNLESSIDTIFNEFNTNTNPGLAVAVYQNGEIFFKKGYGLADIENRTPIEANTNFRLASVTKQFTSMCILILAEEGKLSLDDPITKYFNAFPEYGKGITIKNLLQHTSGLLDYEDYIDDTVTIQLKDRDVLSTLMKHDSTYFEPGTNYRYSNSGYALLALIIEEVSGKSFANFLHYNIFSPLGMTNSVAYEKGISEVRNRAFGYSKTDSGFVFSDQSLTSAVLGDGGIYTSVEDMFLWNEALSKNQFISNSMLNEAWRKSKLNDGSGVDYGYGWRLDEFNGYHRIYHTGSTCGFSNVYMRIPGRNLSVIVLMNTRDLPALEYGEKVAVLFLQ